MVKPVSKFCPKGHDKDIVGRGQGGRCKQCRKDNRQPVKTYRKSHCPNGHEIAIVGRDKGGACNGCKREHKIKWDEENQEHVTNYNKKKWANRTPEDIAEKKIADRKSYEKHREERERKNKEYRAKHRKERLVKVTEWRKNNIELVRLYARNYQARRKGRVVEWTDWDNIREFELNKPNGMTTDHIIPISGKLVWGLHVSWNLQYLPPHENFTKLNSCNLLEASIWYGKILEDIGLK